MATDTERYAALRTYAVAWGFLPAELSRILLDVRATEAEFDAMADKAVGYVRERKELNQPLSSAGEAEYESWRTEPKGDSNGAD
jgi:hypothetical protein